MEHIEFLREHYELVSLDEAITRLRSGNNQKIAVAITFDDGYRDNRWAIEYLAYFGIPATFFISMGHVRDGTLFEHDRQAGFHDAWPMSVEEIRYLAAKGFLIGSHGMYHEDFGQLEPGTADGVLRESRSLLAQIIGRAPAHFSFPTGQRIRNITRETFQLAQKYYPYLYSAYGGYNFPSHDRRHFLRIGSEGDVFQLAMIMSGYTEFRNVLLGNAWGLRTDRLPPY